MYRVMIADDEPLMRKYLSNIIPAFNNQFEVVNISKDGQEAIDFLEGTSGEIHVIITDIKMPEVDGLSLAKYVRDRFPSTVVIIISGFSEFEYARKAIQYNVTDYLVKPLKDQNLKEVLDTIATRFAEAGRKSMFHTVRESALEYGAKHGLVQAILDEDTPKIYGAYAKSGGRGHAVMKAAGCIVQCRLLYMARHFVNGGAVESPFFTLNILAGDICDKLGYTSLYGRDGDTYILIDGESPSEIEARVGALYQKIQKANPPGTFDLYCGKPVSDIMLLPQSLKSIDEIRLLSVNRDENIFLFPAVWHQSETLQSIQRLQEQIQKDILSGDWEGLRADVRYLCDHYVIPAPTGLWRAGEILIEQASVQCAVDEQRISAAYQILSNACLSHSGRGDWPQHATGLFQALAALLQFESNTVPQEPPVIRRAKEFILDNFQNNISLSDVASYCGVSGSYLSDFFQKHMGITYSKYLSQLRMEQAAKLLKNYPEIKVYEVATRTGFVSPKHFISVFKKYYGVSPLNFQKNAHRDANK